MEELKMTRLQGVLAAGALTGTVLATAVALGIKDLNQASTPTPVPAIIPATQPQASPMVEPANLVDIQAREALYRAQIEQANQTIQQLQAERDQLAQQSISAQAPRGGEGHELEHEEEYDDD